MSHNTPQTHYEVLGIRPYADISEIKSAYKARALETHPDKNGGTVKAKEAFQHVRCLLTLWIYPLTNLQLINAYEVLSDVTQRKSYDQTLSYFSKPQSYQPKPFSYQHKPFSYQPKPQSYQHPTDTVPDDERLKEMEAQRQKRDLEMEEQRRKRELQRQERSKEWADRKRERKERRCKGPVSNCREREKKGEQKRSRMRSDED